ncbi:MAG: nucleotide exchange factor GrpE [Elusimicrobia bacterium]|nr:nucleotide exchange factor GrpE [Elusimicrobiota bacterium]MDD7578378.1 nucleotide exchange factor GrpE [Elusimicrobiota bacterium]MDY6039109.1 nucleotide exchange factor GrpE [Elusimicrobiaceae bacterium]
MSKKHKHEQSAEQELDERDLPEVAEPEVEVKPEDEPAEEQKPDYYAQLVRLSADFDNFRKRTEREKASFLAYGKKQLAEKLLPSYEVLLRQAEKMDKQDASAECSAELKGVKDGIKMVLTEMEKAFRSEGIERMDVLDKPYDPQTQEVVAMIPSSVDQDGLVLQEVQMGFLMDGKVLRPARVIVGQHAEG